MTNQSIITQIENTISKLEKALEDIEDNEMIKPEPFLKIISELKQRAKNLGKIQDRLDEIKEEIIAPVSSELKEASRLGKFSKWGFILGGIGLTVTILSLIFGTFGNYLLGIGNIYDTQLEKDNKYLEAKLNKLTQKNDSLIVQNNEKQNIIDKLIKAREESCYSFAEIVISK